MLNSFTSTHLGQKVVENCAKQFLAELSGKTGLVVMFGMRSQQNYVKEYERIIRGVRGSPGWQSYDEVSYGDEATTFLHVEHFKSRGALIPNWFGALDASGKPKDLKRVHLASLSIGAVKRFFARPNATSDEKGSAPKLG